VPDIAQLEDLSATWSPPAPCPLNVKGELRPAFDEIPARRIWLFSKFVDYIDFIGEMSPLKRGCATFGVIQDEVF
jgi:hypothetical protein